MITGSSSKSLFNPRANLQVVKFDDRHFCLVIDDALAEPEQLVQFAAERSDAFRSLDFSAYPGNYLMAPEQVVSGLRDFFLRQVRRHFDARRCEHVHCRYSMVTLPPAALRPRQWFCHVDDALFDARHRMIASVLYLFKDESLGGTSFYVQTRPAADTAAMLNAADTLSPEAFTQQYGIQAGYQHGSNAYYRRIGGAEAKWNRLIFYDGGTLHSGDIARPEKLSVDPRVGRLTLNGFFTCRRHLDRPSAASDHELRYARMST